MKKILLTGGGGAGNEALNRLLGDRYELHFADADISAIDPSISKELCHQIPFACAPNFKGKICDLCSELKIDLLVPGVDEELSICANLASDDLKVLLPPKKFVDTHLDKFESMKVLGNFAPKTFLAEDAKINAKSIVKPRSGRGSRGVAVVESQKQLLGYLALNYKTPAIVQELGVGQEFTVMMAADANANLRAIVPVAVGVKRGITLRAETRHDEVVEDSCQKIHEANPVSGCYNIQLIRQEDDRVIVFEINPRVSTTFCLGVTAGVDPIDIFLNTPSEAGLLPFKEKVQLARFWNNKITKA